MKVGLAGKLFQKFAEVRCKIGLAANQRYPLACGNMGVLKQVEIRQALSQRNVER